MLVVLLWQRILLQYPMNSVLPTAAGDVFLMQLADGPVVQQVVQVGRVIQWCLWCPLYITIQSSRLNFHRNYYQLLGDFLLF